MRKQYDIRFDPSEAAEKVRQALERPIEERSKPIAVPPSDPTKMERWALQPVPTRSKKRRW